MSHIENMEGLSVRDAEVIAERAKNTPIRAVAKQVGISTTTVQKIGNKHKEIIATQQARLVEATLPVIIDRAVKEINHANSMDVADKDAQTFLARVDKKEETILKSVGIAPSNTQSMHVTQIYNDNRKETLNPNVASMLHGKLDEMTEEIVDADFEEVK